MENLEVERGLKQWVLAIMQVFAIMFMHKTCLY